MCGEAKNGVTEEKINKVKGAGRAKCGVSEMCVVLEGNKKLGKEKGRLFGQRVVRQGNKKLGKEKGRLFGQCVVRQGMV